MNGSAVGPLLAHAPPTHTRSYRLAPMGSFSRIIKRDDDKLVFDLFCASDIGARALARLCLCLSPLSVCALPRIEPISGSGAFVGMRVCKSICAWSAASPRKVFCSHW